MWTYQSLRFKADLYLSTVTSYPYISLFWLPFNYTEAYKIRRRPGLGCLPKIMKNIFQDIWTGIAIFLA